MRIPKNLRLVCIFTISLLMSNIPNVALASEMISTQTVVGELNRSVAEEKVRGFLEREEVQKALEAQGLDKDEATQRLASLSDSELKQLTTQMQEAKYGGDVLITVILILLIIFLARRI